MPDHPLGRRVRLLLLHLCACPLLISCLYAPPTVCTGPTSRQVTQSESHITSRPLTFPHAPQQVTFRLCNPKTNTNVWKSVGVTNFKVQGDKRSCKSDQVTVTMDPTNGNKYTIQAKYDEEVQISIVYERVADGFKLGDSPRGGFTYFGQLSNKPAPANGSGPDYAAGGDGYAIHRFWPRCHVSGIVRNGKDVHDLDGSRGVFIHAIQGLRPNLLAANWNFANFQSVEKEGEEAVSLIMMEFTTTPQYGAKTINVGSVVVGDKLVGVTAGGSGVVGGSNVTHVDPVPDAETDYDAPSALKYSWEATRLEDGKPAAGNAKVHAVLKQDLLLDKDGYKTRGLVEKVDVLGQIPYLIRKFVNYAAGTKPYIYTVRPALGPIRASTSRNVRIADTLARARSG